MALASGPAGPLSRSKELLFCAGRVGFSVRTPARTRPIFQKRYNFSHLRGRAPIRENAPPDPEALYKYTGVIPPGKGPGPHLAGWGQKSLVRQFKIKWMPEEYKRWVDFPEQGEEQHGEYPKHCPATWDGTSVGDELFAIPQQKLKRELTKRVGVIVNTVTQMKQFGEYTVQPVNVPFFVFRQAELHEEILSRFETQFDILVPEAHREAIDSVENLVKWAQIRIEMARGPANFNIPDPVDKFLDGYMKQKELLVELANRENGEAPEPRLPAQDYDWENWTGRADMHMSKAEKSRLGEAGRTIPAASRQDLRPTQLTLGMPEPRENVWGE